MPNEIGQSADFGEISATRAKNVGFRCGDDRIWPGARVLRSDFGPGFCGPAKPPFWQQVEVCVRALSKSCISGCAPIGFGPVPYF